MTTYGLTTEGFVPKTEEIILEEMKSAIRAALGASLLLTPQSVLGVIIGIMSERYAELWELAEAVNSSQDPDYATGAALAGLCALTGTLPRAATQSTVTLDLTGTNGTTIPSGSLVATASTGVEFSLDADVTLATLTSWAISTAYVVGDKRTNAGRCYVCITAGTSAGAGGPTTTADDITDNTAHWRYMGEGAASATGAASSVLTGEIAALSGDLTEIVSPVGGWSSVINLLDADLGREADTDGIMRIRRQAELAQAGSSPVDAIRAAVLALDGVTSCTVFENNTDITDGEGVPPHAVQVLVRGGTDQDIWDCLLASVSAGTATYGLETGTALDSEGVAHTMNFSRPTEVLVYVDVTLIKDPDTYPADGDTQVKEAIVAWGDLQATGKNVVSSALLARVFEVAGVLEVNLPLIDDAPAPTLTTTIAIGTRELAVYDTSRITVTSSDGTP